VGDTASLTSDLEDLVGYCSQRLGALSTAGWRPPPGWTVDRILDRLRAMQDASGEEVHARAWCHGDFGPSNILWDGQVITGIDLGIAHIGHPLADATYFIHRVEMLALSFQWKRWPVARWRGAFLRGFGRPDVEGQALYNALMARHLLCRLASLYRRPGHSWKQRLHVTWLRPRIAAELTRVLSDANNRPLR
jgi:Ser/Thr protein kinase RdoA (MazF antagonist)